MFDKLNHLAEQAATSLSRRDFLGNLGRAALLVATGAAGILTDPSAAVAATRVCAADSPVIACRGLPLGSPCVAGNNRPGRCVSDGGIRVSPGVYSCNYCKPKGSPRE